MKKNYWTMKLMKYDENEQDNDDEDKDNKNTYENEAYKTASENENEKAAREIDKTFFGYSTKKLSKK